MYLASLGVKAANVPLVPDVALPDGVTDAKGQLVVGLTVDPSRLAHVRQTRLAALGGDRSGDYADLDRINDEVRAARQLFLRRGWPIIDVTHNSVEQTASQILELLRKAGGVSVSDA
jgi:regulator of PEP synthase PpsR (kinase-PPPase family)